MIIILTGLFLSAAHTGDHDDYNGDLLQRFCVDVHDHSDFDHGENDHLFEEAARYMLHFTSMLMNMLAMSMTISSMLS